MPMPTSLATWGTFFAAPTAGESRRTYWRNQAVFSQGDAADAVFYLQAGAVTLTVASAGGEEAVLGVLGEGSFCGEGCLTGQDVRASTARASEPSTIVRVEMTTMAALMRSEPRAAAIFLAHLLSRGALIEQDLINRILVPVAG